MKWIKKTVNIVWQFVKFKKYYKYVLDHTFKLKHDAFNGVSFSNEWVTIANGYITINAGYAWDGCSPKFKLLGIPFGVPDGKNDETKWASLVHDAICQFREFIKISKMLVLRVFKDQLLDAGWDMTPEYVDAVDKFGPQDFLIKDY